MSEILHIHLTDNEEEESEDEEEKKQNETQQAANDVSLIPTSEDSAANHNDFTDEELVTRKLAIISLLNAIPNIERRGDEDVNLETSAIHTENKVTDNDIASDGDDDDANNNDNASENVIINDDEKIQINLINGAKGQEREVATYRHHYQHQQPFENESSETKMQKISIKPLVYDDDDEEEEEEEAAVTVEEDDDNEHVLDCVTNEDDENGEDDINIIIDQNVIQADSESARLSQLLNSNTSNLYVVKDNDHKLNNEIHDLIVKSMQYVTRRSNDKSRMILIKIRNVLVYVPFNVELSTGIRSLVWQQEKARVSYHFPHMDILNQQLSFVDRDDTLGFFAAFYRKHSQMNGSVNNADSGIVSKNRYGAINAPLRDYRDTDTLVASLNRGMYHFIDFTLIIVKERKIVDAAIHGFRGNVDYLLDKYKPRRVYINDIPNGPFDTFLQYPYQPFYDKMKDLISPIHLSTNDIDFMPLLFCERCNIYCSFCKCLGYMYKFFIDKKLMLALPIEMKVMSTVNEEKELPRRINSALKHNDLVTSSMSHFTNNAHVGRIRPFVVVPPHRSGSSELIEQQQQQLLSPSRQPFQTARRTRLCRRASRYNPYEPSSSSSRSPLFDACQNEEDFNMPISPPPIASSSSITGSSLVSETENNHEKNEENEEEHNKLYEEEEEEDETSLQQHQHHHQQPYPRHYQQQSHQQYSSLVPLGRKLKLGNRKRFAARQKQRCWFNEERNYRNDGPRYMSNFQKHQHPRFYMQNGTLKRRVDTIGRGIRKRQRSRPYYSRKQYYCLHNSNSATRRVDTFGRLKNKMNKNVNERHHQPQQRRWRSSYSIGTNDDDDDDQQHVFDQTNFHEDDNSVIDEEEEEEDDDDDVDETDSVVGEVEDGQRIRRFSRQISSYPPTTAAAVLTSTYFRQPVKRTFWRSRDACARIPMKVIKRRT